MVLQRARDAIADKKHLDLPAVFGERQSQPQAVIGPLHAVRGVVEDNGSDEFTLPKEMESFGLVFPIRL